MSHFICKFPNVSYICIVKQFYKRGKEICPHYLRAFFMPAMIHIRRLPFPIFFRLCPFMRLFDDTGNGSRLFNLPKRQTISSWNHKSTSFGC
nr:MAG TPA: hypothetical protein [Caudoviricetes sp.]